MLENLLIGLPTVAFCLLLQSLLCLTALRYYSRRRHAVESTSFWSSMGVIIGVMVVLFIGNFAQLCIWALLFLVLGEFAVLEDAIYHSAVNFSSLGYGDIVMSQRHRLLGPLETINGVLMIGVSTAVLTAAFQDAMKKTLQARHAEASAAD